MWNDPRLQFKQQLGSLSAGPLSLCLRSPVLNLFQIRSNLSSIWHWQISGKSGSLTVSLEMRRQEVSMISWHLISMLGFTLMVMCCIVLGSWCDDSDVSPPSFLPCSESPWRSPAPCSSSYSPSTSRPATSTSPAVNLLQIIQIN